MPIIEGIGDEVTFVFAALILALVLIFAWFSTRTDDITLFREVGLIMVEFHQRSSRHPTARTNTGALRSQADEGTSQTTGSESPSEVAPTGGAETLAACEGEQTSGNVERASASSSELFTDRSEVTAVRSQSEENLKSTSESAQVEMLDTCNVIPKAEVVAEEGENANLLTSSLAHPDGEEMRQRRVQYFQTNQGESTCAQDNANVNYVPGGSLTQSTRESSLSTALTTDECVQASSSSSSQSSGDTCSDSRAVPVPQSETSISVEEQLHSADDQPGENFTPDGLSSSCIRVKLRYMNETQRYVYAKPDDTIGAFRRAHFQTELSDNKWVRFIFNGQDLRDDSRTLQACSIVNNCTMHCLVTAHNRTAPHQEMLDTEEDSMLGALMYPLFTILLLIVWYFRLTYRQYFSAMSTVCLIGISFLLALSYISSLRISDSLPQQPPARGPQSTPGPAETSSNHPHSN